MKLIVCLMTCVLLLGIAASTGDALAYRWNVKTSEHFILYYQNAPADAVDLSLIHI